MNKLHTPFKWVCFFFFMLNSINGMASEHIISLPIVGAEQPQKYLPKLQNKRIGLVVNPTSRVFNQHLVDYLRTQSVNITAIFSPEHGFRGNHDAGAIVSSSQDKQTGLPVYSLYGKTKKPTGAMLENVDILIFDIQDVGARFYTYISTMHFVLEAAAESDKFVIILDRPNPNVKYVDGPILEPAFKSFVGMHPIPVLHGMTVGELALMINGEGWLTNGMKAQLSVIPVANYTRNVSYDLPVKPSPNLPNAQSIALYPSLCFFEATPVSIGRGTDFPFQVIGHNTLSIGNFSFRPRSIVGVAQYPKLENQSLKGQDLRAQPAQGLQLSWLLDWAKLFIQHEQVFFNRADFMDKLAGTDRLRKQIESGMSEQEIRDSWQSGLQQFKTQRRAYLLYEDK